jgi:predicted dehydrogenase
LGAGGISGEHIDALKTIPEARLVAVCDNAVERAQELQQKYGIPKVFGSLRDLLASGGIDVVHVLTPPALHVPLAIQCLEAGTHVFVEKPLGVSVEECQRLAKAAEKARRAVGVNHNALHAPRIRELAKVVASRRIGRIYHASVVVSRPWRQLANLPANHFIFQSPENILLEFAPHPLSVLRSLVGGPKEVSSIVSGERKTRSGAMLYSSWQSSMICERATAQVLFAFGSGYRSFSVQVFGEDGVASVDGMWAGVRVHEATHIRREPVALAADALENSRRMLGSAAESIKDTLLGYVGRSTTAMRDSIADFYTALAANRPPPQGLVEGTQVVDYCERIWHNRAGSTSVQKGSNVAVG